jgi:transcriptional regulator with XRE-family HTH domain
MFARAAPEPGLVELGKHTGLSAASLSKLERGKLFPTLPTRLRIAMVFGVGLDYFFTDERKRRVMGGAETRAGALRETQLRADSQPGRWYLNCYLNLN